MKQILPIIFSALLFGSSVARAQLANGGGALGPASNSTSGAGASTGTTFSNGATINGTGGSAGPNTANALNHGTTGNNFGAGQTAPASGQSPASTSHGNAVDTPTANSAAQSLGNTDAGVLKK